MPGTSGDVYLEGLCGGIISNLGVWLYFFLNILKQKVRLKDNAENDMFFKKYNTLHRIKENHQVDYRYAWACLYPMKMTPKFV